MKPHDPPDPVRGRIGMDDVRRIEAVTRRYRDADYRHGGGSCRDEVVGCLKAARTLLEASTTDDARTRLRVALADLHNLAGWACFDIGDVRQAHTHLDEALLLARDGGNDDILANIHYRLGRIHLHHHQPSEALARFQLGELLARRSGAPRSISLLLANQAWAHARMGADQRALALLDEAHEIFEASSPDTPPPWTAFFDATDLAGLTGAVHTELAQHVDTSYTSFAVPTLTTAVNNFGNRMVRSRALCLILLATNHLIEGDLEHGAKVGIQAVTASRTLHSTRVKDRMRPLVNETYRHRDNPHTRDLADHMATLGVA